VPGATSYRIKRASVSGGPFTTFVTGLTALDFADNTITNGATFHYLATAVNAYGESANSAEVSAAVPFPHLIASAAAGHVSLVWSNPASQLTIRSATNLTPPVAWHPVTNVPQWANGWWQLEWVPNDAVRFFRLSVE
jgi:hypothetical protein